MNFFTLSDKGKVRSNNEDYAESLYISKGNPDGGFSELGILLLCDGMGGGPAGERASYLAVSTMKESIVNDWVKYGVDFSDEEYLEYIDKYIQKCQFNIFKEGVEDQSLYGMGTTIVAGLIVNNSLNLAHIGDSRGYSYGQETGLISLTKDHSLVQQYVDEGKITPDEAFCHPQRNIITRVLGAGSGAPVKVDKKTVPLADGDIVLFCTDGLCGVLENSEITQLIQEHYKPENTDLRALANALIAAACLRGGPDNVTVALYQHTLKANN